MAILMTVETVSGLTVKKALQFLKPFRPRALGNWEVLRYVEVKQGQWRVTDLYREATVPAPLALPDGVYDLFQIMPVLSSTGVRVEGSPTGVIVNGVSVWRREVELPNPSFATGRAIDLGVLPVFWDLLRAHTAKDESRPALQGICLDPVEQVAVATDGSRMAKVPWPSLKILSNRVVVPAIIAPSVGMRCVIRMDGQTPISMELSGPQGTVRARLLPGQYPDYNRVIPRWEAAPLRFHVTAGTLLQWAKQVQTLAQAQRCPAVDVVSGTVARDDHGDANLGSLMSLRSGECEIGGSDGEVWAQEEGSILVTPRFLVDLAKHLPRNADCHVAFHGIQTPVTCRVEGCEIIIAPLRWR